VPWFYSPTDFDSITKTLQLELGKGFRVVGGPFQTPPTFSVIDYWIEAILKTDPQARTVDPRADKDILSANSDILSANPEPRTRTQRCEWERSLM
jgi:hypothetical protein